LEIVFDGNEANIIEDKAVDKPKSVLHHRRPSKTKINYLVYEDKEKKEIE
jgi:hypothetical protein